MNDFISILRPNNKPKKVFKIIPDIGLKISLASTSTLQQAVVLGVRTRLQACLQTTRICFGGSYHDTSVGADSPKALGMRRCRKLSC
jgi:hypothetical protein